MGPQTLTFLSIFFFFFGTNFFIFFSKMLKKLQISMQTCNGETAGITKLHFQNQHFVTSPTLYNIQTIFYSRQFLSRVSKRLCF